MFTNALTTNSKTGWKATLPTPSLLLTMLLVLGLLVGSVGVTEASAAPSLIEGDNSCVDKTSSIEQLEGTSTLYPANPVFLALVGQSFTVPTGVTEADGVTAYFGYIAAGATITLNLYEGPASGAIGTPIATASYTNLGAAISASPAGIDVSFEFSSPVSLTPGNVYYYLLPVNYNPPYDFAFTASPDNPYSEGTSLRGGSDGNVATWVGTYDHKFSVYTCDDNVLSDFNQPDGPIGSNWNGDVGAFSISGNNLVATGGGADTDIYWNDAFGPDQYVFATFDTVPPYGYLQLLLKAQTSGNWYDGVLDVLYDPNSNVVQVWTYEWISSSGGPGWVQHGADIPVTLNDGDKFGAHALANGMVEVYVNGALVGTRDVSSWSYYDQGGYPGLWMEDAFGVVLDDFGGGNLP